MIKENRTSIVFGIICAVIVAPFANAQDGKPTLAEITDAWLNSPHADRSSPAFTHWDEDGEIPGSCAVCHASTGVIDYLSAPITSAGILGHPVAIGTSVDCAACHNSAAGALSAVPFPSGVVVEDLGSSAICAVCHQGRTSTQTVLGATEGLEEDTVSADLGFINVHYVPSAATSLGALVQGGFEYPGKEYRGEFAHVPNLNNCTDCHNPHNLQVSLESCTTCHQGAQSFGDIRISAIDFDGDGNTTEGISQPIATMHDRLLQAIVQYAAEVVTVPIVYTDAAYPYFFTDTDGDGTAGPGEAIYPNRYKNWTPRLLKAAYNYQLVAKEPAIYTHNPHYALQLLYDSLENLSETVTLDMEGFVRP